LAAFSGPFQLLEVLSYFSLHQATLKEKIKKLKKLQVLFL